MRSRYVILILGLIASAFGAGFWVSTYFSGRTSKEHVHDFAPTNTKERYSCPMHPSVISDHPDKCPICGMDLQKVDSEPQSKEVATKSERKILFYRHPMQPDKSSPVPAKDEMGMDFIPVYEDELEEASESQVKGRGSFTLSQERQQLIGVTTAPVAKHPLSIKIRASGKVAFDPDLYTAIEEYRQAALSFSQLQKSSYQSISEQAEQLVKSSRVKLRLMGLTDAQINRLQGQNADPMNLLLPKGSAWVYAEVYEYETAALKVGQKIEISAPSVPGKTFSGKITSISPVLNSSTRTVRVRAQIPDPDSLLRPDTFVNARIEIDLGEKLVIPSAAVLHSGEQTFAFLVIGAGRFEPSPITLGAKAGDFYELISGLNEGDLVVSSANFLIDSESRLRGAIKRAESFDAKNTTPSGAP